VCGLAIALDVPRSAGAVRQGDYVVKRLAERLREPNHSVDRFAAELTDPTITVEDLRSTHLRVRDTPLFAASLNGVLAP
jgi:hypothetical protein